MKYFYQLVLVAIGTLCIISAAAQQQPVRFANGQFIPSGNISKHSFQPADIAAAQYGDTYFVLMQFGALPSEGVKQKLKTSGVTLFDYYPGNAYQANIKNTFDFNQAAGLGIVSIDMIPAFYKIHQKIRTYKAPLLKEDAAALAIHWFGNLDAPGVQLELTKAGARIVTSKFGAAKLILAQYDAGIINLIAALPFVSSVTIQPIVDKPINYKSRAAHSASGLNSSTGKNLNGKGVTVGIGDNADVSSHLDFTGRLINRSPGTGQNHGVHTAGSTTGAGLINPTNRGMAPKATVIGQYFSDVIVQSPTYITDYDMVLSNNSYHSAENGCDGEREYNFLSYYADNQMKNNPHLLHVFAAGNDGASTCAPYPTSFGTVKSGWQCGKNVLTVGALRLDNYSIAVFSGRGPVADGRLKPEITANGSEVLSTNANNTYGFNSGTSMACPQVTGALALMYERYRQIHGSQNPTSALMKAIVCNTAEDMGNAGPDYTFGFGMLNARRAVEAIDSGRYIISNLSNGGSKTHSINIPSNTRRVKIMLYWADVPSSGNAAVALVNDLDLVVNEPGELSHLPLILNSTPSNVNAVAIEGADHVNNIEQVTINNPVAGTYTISVAGTNVPLGPQEYIVTYEFIPNSVTVAYPEGGETWVPGEAETIRWSGFGNEGNAFTIQYSTDNGGSWTTIDNNVPAGRRSYLWTVPSVTTNTAIVKISRNGTGFTDQSNAFTILGQPQVSATSVCEGAVQLDWGSVAGATSFDVLMLKGDSMSVIGNTSAVSYLATGLEKNKLYWFSVAAKNGSKSGRRSNAVSIQANTGACLLAAFANDLKIDSILEPTSARQFFSNATNATRPVKVSIKNSSAAAISGPFTVSYSYGTATVVTENINTSIAAGASYTYVFTGAYPINPSGFEYNFKAWVTHPGDANNKNDTAYKLVKYINNDAITTLPLLEGFESMPVVETQSAELAVGGNARLDFSSSRTRGRLRTAVNTGFAFAGIKALTLDQTPYSATSNADSATLNYNLSNYTGKQLRLDLYYRNHGQSNLAANRIWIRGSESNAWVQAYNLFDNQGGIGEWKKALVNISDVLATANPAQVVTPTFQIRLGQQGNFSTNSPNPVSDLDDGYTFDNIVLTEALNDVSAININSPDKGGCGLTAGSPISVKLKNYNNTVLNNVEVSYKVNNGPVVTETIANLAANQTLDYVFNQLPDFSDFIDYNINVWVKYGPDNYAANDSVLNYQVHNSPIVTSYPFLETFEQGDGYFYTGGTNSTWQWGAPGKTIINKAPNGAKAWVTNLDGNHSDNETSYLFTPCFNLTGLRKPVLSFSHIFDIEQDYDYTWVEYTTDGKTWLKLGAVNSGTNWYDNAALRNWRISKTKWHVASIDIPVTNTTVKFRFVFSSDEGVTQEGVAIDDVRVHEKTIIADSVPGGQFITANVAGNNWTTFNWGDSIAGPWYVLAEVNSNGQNLGAVTVTPYLDTNSTIKNSNNAYYGNRSYVLRAANSPSGAVKVRFYLTDKEASAMMNAGSCSACIQPYDPYELGVVRYHGIPTEEDSTLSNNRRGFYQFISPDSTSIMPHGNGYYAEFTVANFGECWFSKGDITPPAAAGCAGNAIAFNAAATGSVYQWQVNTGSGFTNISNNAQYTGANSATLKINNPATSITGFQYRCVVDGTNGPANTVRFANYWIGATSTDWFAAANWSCDQVPDEFTDVVIPAGASKYPVLNASTAIRSINMQPGVPVIINTGVNLEVKGQ